MKRLGKIPVLRALKYFFYVIKVHQHHFSISFLRISSHFLWPHHISIFNPNHKAKAQILIDLNQFILFYFKTWRESFELKSVNQFYQYFYCHFRAAFISSSGIWDNSFPWPSIKRPLEIRGSLFWQNPTFICGK